MSNVFLLRLFQCEEQLSPYVQFGTERAEICGRFICLNPAPLFNPVLPAFLEAQYRLEAAAAASVLAKPDFLPRFQSLVL
jgi:hypothetical protein